MEKQEFLGFFGKLTDGFLYIESKLDENRKYRISGSIKSLWKYIEKNDKQLKLIPFMKQLAISHFKVETRTTQNKKTGKWLWIPGYTAQYNLPSGTLGGLSPFGTTFLGEYDEDTGRPINLGMNRNSQKKGALKGEKTQSWVNHLESKGKWDSDELELLRKWKREAEERKWDLREKSKRS